MATVNRYTQTKNSVYQPRTLQELMIAPAYKRQKHDELDAGIAQYESQLAQADGLDVHGDRLSEEQQKLYNEALAQRDKLEAEGFSQSAKSDFLRFNKQYQQAVGPRGVIGKIGTAKATFQQEKENYIANATKMGYSPESAAANWEDHAADYKRAYEEGKEINPIEGLYAPNYKDPVTELRSLLKEAGMESSDISDIGSEIIYDPTKGSYVLTTKDRDRNDSNTKALNEALLYMNNQVLNPRSDIGKSVAHARKSPQDVLDELSGLNKVYQKTSEVREDASQISQFSAIKSDDKITSRGAGLAIASTQYAPAKFTGKSYQDIQEGIHELEAKGSDMDEEDKIALMEMKDFQTAVENELKADDRYNELEEVYKAAAKTMNAVREETYDYKLHDSYNPKDKLNSILGINSQLMHEERLAAEAINEYTKPFIENAKLQVTEYAILPETTKQNSAYKIMNQNADRLLRVNPQSLEQLGDINEIIDPNGNSKPISHEDDIKGIANMIFKSAPGSVSVVSFVGRGRSGKPEIVFNVKTDKNNTYDLDGLMRGEEYTDVIGGGNPLQVRLAFDTSKIPTAYNGVELNNLMGYLQDYMASTGPLGAELVASQRFNQFKSKHAGKTWGDVVKDKEKVDTETEMAWTEALRREGVTDTSSNEELQAAMDKVKKKQIRR